jgi:hypothetical protein
MPTEDKPALTAKTTIDLEAVAALDAALCLASRWVGSGWILDLYEEYANANRTLENN